MENESDVGSLGFKRNAGVPSLLLHYPWYEHSYSYQRKGKSNPSPNPNPKPKSKPKPKP